jgi:16S rRNA (cytosine967-C5)-methyltransferase
VTPPARHAAAIELLAAVDGAPARPADAVANDFFRTRRYIGGGDRRAVSDAAWSALRARRRLGWWLARGGAEATPRLMLAARLVLDGMKLRTVEELHAGSAYAAAALTEAELAALRPLEGHTVDHPSMPLGVRYEVPDFVLPGFEARYGEELEAELAAALLPAPLDLRVNLLKADREAARAALREEGHEAQPTRYSPWGLRLAGRRSITTGAAFRAGLVEIQDEGSQLVAALAGAGPEMRVLDWCAGAGGKALAMAAAMGNRGHLVACDVSAPRLEAAAKRLRRAGVQNTERHLVVPGDKWAKRRAGGFDRVLVDAPCTGTGTWRRNPDARHRLTERDVAELVVKQAAILDTAARLVKPGGWLVYATCSVLPAENEGQVESFLARTPGFSAVPLAAAWALPGAPPSAGPALSLSPRRHGTDGFFGAVLRRDEAPPMAGAQGDGAVAAG